MGLKRLEPLASRFNDEFLTPENKLKSLIQCWLQDLAFKHKSKIKANKKLQYKQPYTLGANSCTKKLSFNNEICLIVLSSDADETLDGIIKLKNTLRTYNEQKDVQLKTGIVRCFSRNKLGRILRVRGSISVCAIHVYPGSNERVSKILKDESLSQYIKLD
ncbi:MAG: hypothetical protein MHPSP_002895 [Paramarteilia canceri]